MRIPLKFSSTLQTISFEAFYYVSGLHGKSVLATFTIDSGSRCSLLSYNEVIKTNLPVTKLKKHKEFPSVSIAGHSFDLFSLKRVRIALLDSNNKGVQLHSKVFSAAYSNSRSNKKREEAKQIPCLIGMDFLIEQGLGLHILPSRKTAYLEKK